MASLIRPQVFRQAAAADSSVRCLSRTTPVTSSVLKSTTQAQASRPAFVRDSLPGATRVAAFHASASRAILPPLPQRLQGTANEAAPVPTPHATEGAYHWVMERAVSVALIPITIAPFVGGSLNPTLDAVFCGLLVVHSHVGFTSCITDYFPKKRTPKTRKTLEYTLLGASFLTAYGLWEFETNDVGLVEATRRIWKA